MADDDVTDVARILIEHGPLSKDDIVARLQAEGVPDAVKVATAGLAEAHHPVVDLNDGRWVWQPAVVLGRILTHRVDAAEVTADALVVDPDLDPITGLCHHSRFQRLADGSAVSLAMPGWDDDLLLERGISPESVPESGVLLLKPGTLRALKIADGDLVGVRLSAAGLSLERVETTLPAVDVGATLAESLPADEPSFLDSTVLELCVADPLLFTEPMPPLTEIVESQGLVRRYGMVARPDFDFDQWRFERDCDRLALRHDIEPDDALALRTLMTIYDQMSDMLTRLVDVPDEPVEDDAPTADDSGYGDLIAEFGAALAEPFLAELFRNETVGNGGSPAALGLFAETLEPQVPRSARVALRWLRAVALELTGQIEEAEREYLAAESMDTEWPLTLFDLARFASDRGDADRALALLRRTGTEPDHPLTQLLEQHRPAPRDDLGRNDTCWCGSGRKYKKCHLGREQLPLAGRVGWLYFKACQYVFVTPWRELFIDVADARDAYLGEDDELPEDPLFVDAVLFEGGAFADFLATRGVLLPDDERLLAEQWQLSPRSLFEVQEVESGRRVQVRDVRTGDVYDVHERTASRELRPGQLICTRVAPAPETYEFFGGIEPVALHERDQLINVLDSDPDPVDLVEFLSRRFAPPTMVNTEGDLLTLCEATVRVNADIEPLLDNAYDRVEEDTPAWLDHVMTHGNSHISATLTLDGDRLAVQTNSERRMDRVLAAIADLDPSMTVLDDVRRPLRDTADVAELASTMPGSAPSGVDRDDPAVVAAMDEAIRRYEAAWLDEPIPALDGYTPRQAADDPTRRGDLIALLDTFPVLEGAVGMDAERLRAALGLAEPGR